MNTTLIHTNWHPGKKHSDVDRWICIYPAYINSKKTRQQGRRLPKECCVENPTVVEIRDVLYSTNLQIVIENKLYSRERSRELLYRGRIRVQTRNDDGTYINPELTSREAVMMYAAKRIPELKSRQPKSDPHHNAHGTTGNSKKHKNRRR